MFLPQSDYRKNEYPQYSYRYNENCNQEPDIENPERINRKLTFVSPNKKNRKNSLSPNRIYYPHSEITKRRYVNTRYDDSDEFDYDDEGIEDEYDNYSRDNDIDHLDYFNTCQNIQRRDEFQDFRCERALRSFNNRLNTVSNREIHKQKHIHTPNKLRPYLYRY